METGIAAAVVGWLARERVGAILQFGDAVVADVGTGVDLRRGRVIARSPTTSSDIVVLPGG